MLVRGGTLNRLGFARMGAFCIPASGKKSVTGEDGFYIAKSGRSIGVADGVGGWAEQGVDPSIFTRRFMKYALEEAESLTAAAAAASTGTGQGAGNAAVSSNSRFTSSAIMHTAFEKVMQEKLLGSCAALFATLENVAPPFSSEQADSANNGGIGTALFGKRKKRIADVPSGPYGFLNIASVGDCGVAIIRAGMGVVYASREQQRSFNFPYQLGPEGDTPASALVSDFCVAAGDVVILGTDGLFDNVYPEMLPNVVRNEWRKSVSKISDPNQAKIGASELPPLNCASIAESIAKLAFQGGRDREHLSPFSLRAKMVNVSYEGGKPDDITVIVGQILEVDETGAVSSNGNVEGGSTSSSVSGVAAAAAGSASGSLSGAGLTTPPYRLELPPYHLIEEFFEKIPLSKVQSKL